MFFFVSTDEIRNCTSVCPCPNTKVPNKQTEKLLVNDSYLKFSHDQVPFDKFVNANKLTVNIYMSGNVTGCEIFLLIKNNGRSGDEKRNISCE